MSGRFAPSPTHDFHIGNLRTALLAWSFARYDGRGFIMRMEDLDERCRPEFVTTQLRDLEAIGIDWDGPVIFQSERMAIYDAIAQDLADRDLLYECYCTRKELAEIASAPHRPPGSYPGTCRNLTESERAEGRAKLAETNRGPALRLKTDVVQLTVTDRQLGDYTGAVDDFVIKRGDGVYSYNFVSVVDDGEGVTQIVRGDDLLPSTPRQVYLQRILGLATPEYAHVPLVVTADGVRLAKRDGAVTLGELRTLGWEAGDVVELLADSLGIPGARTASGFLAHFEPSELPREPWQIDIGQIEGKFW